VQHNVPFETDLKKEYREWLEDYIKQGVEEKIFTRFSKALGGYTGMRSPAVCLGTLRVKRKLEDDKELSAN